MSKQVNITNTTTSTKMAEQLIDYLEDKLKKDIVELAEIEKRTTEELAVLPEIEDSKDIQAYIKNAKIKSKRDLLNTKLSIAKRTVEKDESKLYSCKLTQDLVVNNDSFNCIQVSCRYFQLLEEDINTLEVAPKIIIKYPKISLIFRDIFSNQFIFVKTALDYGHVYQQSRDILMVDKQPTYEEFIIYKKSEIRYRKKTYNSYGSNDLSEKEFFKKANKELEELKNLTEVEYDNIFKKLYSDMQKVNYLKKLRQIN